MEKEQSTQRIPLLDLLKKGGGLAMRKRVLILLLVSILVVGQAQQTEVAVMPERTVTTVWSRKI